MILYKNVLIPPPADCGRYIEKMIITQKASSGIITEKILTMYYDHFIIPL